MFSIDLGVGVEDRITGFKGVVIGRVQYVTGCNQYLVQPPVDKDLKHVDAHWYDEHRLTVINKTAIVLGDTTQAEPLHANGACDSAPIK